ncbi:hypothetical protein GCM10007972_18130 [Iodidimonas muriae]|uniref:Thoeris protein ThsB TIR-like domain-containing protein n=1 Tax=Iodidimonas muriae TaxID=261467 RepID=A0ABQ2LE11_9PROT|nr:TIR domain-containing protein [Iodidimonas muriae]GER07166.1 hypothetical protein JCM17843_14760 [Kordiimonadales bacterium JCM 17843]GGO12775.1 hypothetical protein GCM10007972_18130 [Iodidimonas muriae]
MAEETRNVFISHVHEDDDGLGKMKELLGKRGFNIRDGSINAEKPNNATSPEYIKSQILAPRIQWAGTMIVYISPETRNSPWVNWEIEYAHRLGKRIVGVWAHGAAQCDVPDALDQYADAVVGWNSDRIIDAITGHVNDWRTPEGDLRTDRPITRYSC